MSLDACFLSFLVRQLNTELAGARVDKIYMPSRDEAVFVMHGSVKRRLLINVSTGFSHITLTDADFENPATPPAFCMLLRKHFLSSRLERVSMQGFERVAVFEFEGKNDFFEPVQKNIIVELMGRSANMIVTGGDGRIIDAIRRIDLSTSKGRCVLPSAVYAPPPAQPGKTELTGFDSYESLFTNPELTMERAVMDKISGISPIAAREICYLAAHVGEKRIGDMTVTQKDNIKKLFEKLKSDIHDGVCTPTVIRRAQGGKPVDFTFMPVTQYGGYCICESFSNPTDAVCAFFEASSKKIRFEQKTRDLSQILSRTSARISRTLKVRENELAKAEDAEKYRVYGEIINANLHRMKNGMTSLTAENYYDNCNEIRIPLSPELTPSANAGAYFKKYTKAKKSVEVLRRLIVRDRQELSYLDSVFLSLCDASTLADADEIRTELEMGGYLKRRSKTKNVDKKSQPRTFEKDGFTIYVGKNNIQNDYVTVKLSRKGDIWLHTKNVHSSHVLISCGGRIPPDSVIEYAAEICAYYSKAKNDLKVQVDYCPVGNVRKPAGAKPGMVVYDNYKTVVVNPIKEDKLK